MIPTHSDGRTVIHCPRCDQRWRQHGTASGHCPDCHATFYGENAYAKHFRRDPETNAPICIDPMERRVTEAKPGFWIDAEAQWHFGNWESADGYDQRREEAREIARQRFAEVG